MPLIWLLVISIGATKVTRHPDTEGERSSYVYLDVIVTILN
jgi:hypothetical protein